MRSSSGRDSLARYWRFSPGCTRTPRATAQPRRHGLAAPDELEAGREGGAAGGARDDHAAVLERLAQRFEHPLGELGQLVERRRPWLR